MFTVDVKQQYNNSYTFLHIYWLKEREIVISFIFNSETKIAEFANSIDLDEVAHHEPPHLELHCLPSSL